jgi:hypothetical protein
MADNISDIDAAARHYLSRLKEDTLRERPLPIRLTCIGAQADSQTASGWTLVLRRQPARVIGGRPQGGYTDAFELICCDCGDDPDLDYHHAARGLQRIRGPYSISAGIAAYAEHARHHLRRAARHAAQARASKRPG